MNPVRSIPLDDPVLAEAEWQPAGEWEIAHLTLPEGNFVAVRGQEGGAPILEGDRPVAMLFTQEGWEQFTDLAASTNEDGTFPDDE